MTDTVGEPTEGRGSPPTRAVLRSYAPANMLLCMRTTIEIADELFRQAKRRAADQGVTFREVVETALRGYLSGRRETTRYKLAWRTERGRMRPGVDLDDRDALFDLMDGRR